MLYRVTTTFQGNAAVGGGVNQLYFDPTAGTAQQAADAVKAFHTSMGQYYTPQLTWTVESEVETVNNANGQVTGITAVTGGTATGGAGTEMLPPATQGLVRFRTSVFQAGREVRGRMFLPGMTESANDAGKPIASMITAVNGYLTTLLNAPTADLMVYSRTHNFTHKVESATLWNKWATLRSRRD